jgi:hypothetical protein
MPVLHEAHVRQSRPEAATRWHGKLRLPLLFPPDPQAPPSELFRAPLRFLSPWWAIIVAIPHAQVVWRLPLMKICVQHEAHGFKTGPKDPSVSHIVLLH